MLKGLIKKILYKKLKEEIYQLTKEKELLEKKLKEQKEKTIKYTSIKKGEFYVVNVCALYFVSHNNIVLTYNKHSLLKNTKGRKYRPVIITKVNPPDVSFIALSSYFLYLYNKDVIKTEFDIENCEFYTKDCFLPDIQKKSYVFGKEIRRKINGKEILKIEGKEFSIPVLLLKELEHIEASSKKKAIQEKCNINNENYKLIKKCAKCDEEYINQILKSLRWKMIEKDSFSYIVDFLLNPHNSDNKKGFEILFKIFLKEFNKYDILKKYECSEDVFNDFMIKVLFKQNFSLNPTIKEKIEDSSSNIVSYIYKAIHNFLRTKQREVLKRYYTQEAQEKQQSILKKDEYDREREFIGTNDKISPTIIIEAKEILETINKELPEAEKRTLCYMFFEEKEFFEKEISDDAAYKRKSRLKKFLTKFVKEKGFSLEGFSYFVQEFLMSEICKKFR